MLATWPRSNVPRRGPTVPGVYPPVFHAATVHLPGRENLEGPKTNATERSRPKATATQTLLLHSPRLSRPVHLRCYKLHCQTPLIHSFRLATTALIRSFSITGGMAFPTLSGSLSQRIGSSYHLGLWHPAAIRQVTLHSLQEIGQTQSLPQLKRPCLHHHSVS